ncbi:MAG TPA: hypothetical protein PKA38_03955 [Candidatus Levybacteria bacterium]|nr:hypothetical protein [Candidatus Levybacteria bacterium]
MNRIDIEYYYSDKFVLNQFPKQNGMRHREREINAKPHPTPEKSIKENSYITLENFPQLNILAKNSPAISNILENFIAKNGVKQVWEAAQKLDDKNPYPYIKDETVSFSRALGTTFERLTNAWISDLLPNEKGLIDPGSCMRVFKEIDGCPTPDGIIIDKGQLPVMHTFLEYKTNYNRQEENFTQLANTYAFIQELRGQIILFKKPMVLDKYEPTEQYNSIKLAQDANVTLVIPYKYPEGEIPKHVDVIETPFSRETIIEVAHAALSDYKTFKSTKQIKELKF